jgi:hypothetical protein
MLLMRLSLNIESHIEEMINIVTKVITTTDNKSLIDIKKIGDITESHIIGILDKGKVVLEFQVTII